MECQVRSSWENHPDFPWADDLRLNPHGQNGKHQPKLPWHGSKNCPGKPGKPQFFFFFVILKYILFSLPSNHPISSRATQFWPIAMLGNYIDIVNSRGRPNLAAPAPGPPGPGQSRGNWARKTRASNPNDVKNSGRIQPKWMGYLGYPNIAIENHHF